MSKKFYYFSWVVMTSFFGLIMWIYYQLMFPFDVLVLSDLKGYKPDFLDSIRYSVVIEQPFTVVSPAPKSQKGGETARFGVNFIYNYGEAPDVVALLRCQDGSIYDVEKRGDVPKLLGEVGVKNYIVSDYNIINERAVGKVCHFEFDAEWELPLQTIHKRLKTEEFFVQ